VLKLGHTTGGIGITGHTVQQALDLGRLGEDAHPGGQHRSALAQFRCIDPLAGGDGTQFLLESVVRELVLGDGPVEAFVGNGIDRPGDSQLLAHQRGRRRYCRQQYQHQHRPPALAFGGGRVVQATAAWQGADVELRRIAALRHFIQPPASILLTCQMNLDSAIGPLNAAEFWSGG